MATRSNDLTEFAKPIADRLTLRTGSLKVVLSAGVVALSKLSPDERENAIAEAQGVKLESPPVIDSEREFRRKVLAILKEAQKIGVQKKPSRQAKPVKSG